ncbi:MAG: sugar ABC transporter substrate-binding protein [Albidovulum sp.]|nr:sugar ABC transporter substrate-binding protein [Albidovulum sp.]
MNIFSRASAGLVCALMIGNLPAIAISADDTLNLPVEGPYYLKAGQPFAGETVSVLLHETGQYQAVLEQVGQFEELTGINVDVIWTPYPTLHSKVATELTAGGSEIDVLDIAGNWGAEFARFVLPLDQYIEADGYPMDFAEGLKRMYFLEDSWLYIPSRTHGVVTYYRKDIFDDLGLPVPDTWEDMIESAKVIQEATDHSGISIAYSQSVATDFDNIMIWFTMLSGLGGSIFNDDWKPAFNGPVGIEATNRFIDLHLKHGVTPIGANAYTHYESILEFQQGRAAMIPSFEYFFSTLKHPEESAVAETVAVAPYPRWEDGRRVGMVGGLGWGINKKSERIGAAWEFLKWSTSPEVQKAAVLSGGSAVVLHNSTHKDEQLNELFDNMFAMKLESMMSGDVLPIIPEAAQINTVLGPTFSSIIAGEFSVEEGLNQAAEEIEQIMGDAGYY